MSPAVRRRDTHYHRACRYPVNGDKLIEKEGITDLLLCDEQLQPDMLRKIVKMCKGLDIHNIIIIHTPIAGEYAPAELAFMSSVNIKFLRNIPGVKFMKDLLKKYKGTRTDPAAMQDIRSS